jgi:hypothetical protein
MRKAVMRRDASAASHTPRFKERTSRASHLHSRLRSVLEARPAWNNSLDQSLHKAASTCAGA